MTRPARTLVACALLAHLAVAPGARADKPRLHIQTLDVEKFPLVKANLTYVESDGRVVTGKGPTDFKLVFDSNEQGTAADVKTVDQVGEPIYMVMVVQVSTVMHDVIDDVKSGVKKLAQAAADMKGSKVALIAYAQDVKRLAEMGKPEALDGAAAAIAEDTEGTEVHLLDAIRTSLDLLNAKGVPDKGRKLVLVFSDGIDVSGTDKKGFAELGKRANLAGITINTVGYSPFDPTKLRNFNELARQTNGTDRACKTAQDVGAQFSNAADEVRKQYVVLFRSVVQGASREHGIQVLSEQAGVPVYTETVNRVCVDAPEEKPQGRPWWFWLLVIGLPVVALAGILLFLRARAGGGEAVQQHEPVEAPRAPAPAPAAGSNRTMAIDLNVGEKGPTIGWIVGMNGRYADKTFKLQPARTVIGTSTEADIVIDDPKASRKHCEIRYDGLSYKIVDLGSTNGVVLNDKRTPTAELVDGDLFRLGGTDFKFKSIN